MPDVALAHALRAAHRRELARIVVVAGTGVAFLITGPFWIAPICFATATVMYWRRGYAVLLRLRRANVSHPVLDALNGPPRATVVSPLDK